MSKPNPKPFISETATNNRSNQGPLSIACFFSDPDTHPFDQIEWERRSATITDDQGKVIFDQQDVEIPKSYSPLAVKVIASKYFYGEPGSPQRENSCKQLFHRVTRTLADWGLNDNVIGSKEQAQWFYHELTWLCVNQYAAFSSPVWFNVGIASDSEGKRQAFHWHPQRQIVQIDRTDNEYPQVAACFIQRVQDSLESILALATSEAMLFKHGSGTGTDLSPLRSSRETLSGGGQPSGPVSFMRVFDQIAAVIKSGGKTRRAAKMQSLKVTHPDIKEFILAKATEEAKARSLIAQGYDGGINGEAYNSVLFQNANLAVRVSDHFMSAVENDETFQTQSVTRNQPVDTYSAREIMRLIAYGTYLCGEPTLQYESTINRWHTCPNAGAINASNPCSEFMFLDDSACNLASLNLMKFRKADGRFDVAGFCRAIRIMIIAQELLVDHGGYPTEAIAENTHRYRPLGLGYANLGALLMSLGLAYDSDQGRRWASAITALMTGTAYTVSAQMAQTQGAFDGFADNREAMLHVIEMHRAALADIDDDDCPEDLLLAAQQSWDDAFTLGSRYGFRHSQVTALAPTGTISFMMDCDTTGIEPDIALVKYKQLVGGGMFKMVNRTVPLALEKLGYRSEQINHMVDYLEKHDTLETCDLLDPNHLPVFDCAFNSPGGQRTISYLGHLRMMEAVQPFISGAISKTVNMPKDSTVEDIEEAYLTGWRLGLKALAVYRDGSKHSQPLSIQKKTDNKTGSPQAAIMDTLTPRPQRKRLPQTRHSLTHKFELAGHEGYLTVGLYEDGQPGELFVVMAKEGSTIGGLMDAFGISISLALQSGVPLETLVEKFSHSRFEPAGATRNQDIPFAKSLIDYIARWLGMTFLSGYREAHAPKRTKSDNNVGQKENPSGLSELPQTKRAGQHPSTNYRQEQKSDTRMSRGHFSSDAPICDFCGMLTMRCGHCYLCYNCGTATECG